MNQVATLTARPASTYRWSLMSDREGQQTKPVIENKPDTSLTKYSDEMREPKNSSESVRRPTIEEMLAEECELD